MWVFLTRRKGGGITYVFSAYPKELRFFFERLDNAQLLVGRMQVHRYMCINIY